MCRDKDSARFFEDYVVGLDEEVGQFILSEAEIIEFAERYDPQEFHVDPAKAAAGPYKGLIASGWHTASSVMRVMVDAYLDAASSLGSPGLDELRWKAPVRPDDVLTIRARVTDARRSETRPGRGLLHTWIEVINQDGVPVMTIKAVNFIACRGVKPGG